MREAGAGMTMSRTPFLAIVPKIVLVVVLVLVLVF
jgi:hypothetical protein